MSQPCGRCGRTLEAHHNAAKWGDFPCIGYKADASGEEFQRHFSQVPEGRKDDGGKPRWDLLPWGPLEEVAAVLEFGAKKYTRYGECTCSALSARSVVGTPAGAAEAAMTDGSKTEILSTPSASESTPGSGPRPTESIVGATESSHPGSPLRSATDSPLSRSTTSFPEAAKSVAGQTPCASITATPMGAYAGACVSPATSASVGWRAKNGAVEHAPTCPALRVVVRGEGNWQKVEGGSWRYLRAGIGHLAARARGERTDPESGLSHLAHAACCVLFLMWFDKKEGA